jgi:hypothetical protein
MANAQRWELELLNSGRCEPLKAAVHGILLTTAAVCAAYNTAAWLRRRQRHLAINAVLYTVTVLWERCHVVHHLAACAADVPPRRAERPPLDLSDAA